MIVLGWLACTPPPDDPGPPGSTAATGDTSDRPATTATTADTGPAADLPPNVLLLVLDDMGVDKVAAYGLSAVRTPVLDGLAAEGVRFLNAWAYPTCSPSRAATQTGRHARRTGYGSNNNTPDDHFDLAPTDLTLAELLATDPVHAWSTALYGKWHLDDHTPATTEGYGEFGGSLANLDSYAAWTKTLGDGTSRRVTTYATTDTVDDGIAAIGRLAEPWFLEISLNAAHDPFEVPPRALYSGPDLAADDPVLDRERAIVEAADTELGRLLAAMPADLRARTVIVAIGDNGTPKEVFEPGMVGNGKVSLDESGVRVPFLVAGPVVGAPGSVSSALVSVVDLFPTVAALAGLDVSDRVLDGVDLLPVLADPALPVHTTLWAERFVPNGPDPNVDERATRDATHKLVVREPGGEVEFHEFPPDAVDAGPNLLTGTMTADQTAVYEAMREDLEARTAAMSEDLPWPP